LMPKDCGVDPTLAGASVSMRYDRNSADWIATVGGRTTEWGLGAFSQKTPTAYRPEKHILIIGGAGFWFDDDQQVYRSCGNIERQVAKIEF